MGDKRFSPSWHIKVKYAVVGYTARRKNILRTIADRPILEECRGTERRRGNPPRLYWWEQEVEEELLSEEEEEEEEEEDGLIG